MYDPTLLVLVSDTFNKIYATLDDVGSLTSKNGRKWIENGHPSAAPFEKYTHPEAYPMLLFPWYLEQSIQGRVEKDFQSQLVYSTINGYYYIRMMDNLMDNHFTNELSILPLLNVFQVEFYSAYQPFFSSEHPFWNAFKDVWYTSAEVTIQDSHLATIDEDQFVKIAAQKTSAVKIPLTAVCHRYNRLEKLEPWFQFIDRFSCWHQLFNDTFDWRKDLNNQTTTYFISEAKRQTENSDSITNWIVEEGLEWSFNLLAQWMNELKQMSQFMASEQLQQYLLIREQIMFDQQEEAKKGFKQAQKLLNVFNQASQR